jgi:hypothetical protein
MGHLATTILGQTSIATEKMTLKEMEEELEKLEDAEPKAETKTETETTVETVKPVHHKADIDGNILITFEESVWDKMVHWVSLTHKEISGLGCVRMEKDEIFHVYDIFLVDQKNTASFTDTDDDAVRKLMLELDALDEKDDGKRFEDLKFWWHSHAYGAVDWSMQDDHNIQEKLLTPDGKPRIPWWLSLVLNKNGKINTQYIQSAKKSKTSARRSSTKRSKRRRRTLVAMTTTITIIEAVLGKKAKYGTMI